MSEPFHICDGCRERVSPEDPGILRAKELVKTVAMGPTVEWVEGMTAFFHEDCFPYGSPYYRLVSG